MGETPGTSRGRRDADLVEGIRRGNMRDFSVLVDRYRDRAYTLASRILGDTASAEEAVQDAFVRAFRALPRPEANGPDSRLEPRSNAWWRKRQPASLLRFEEVPSAQLRFTLVLIDLHGNSPRKFAMQRDTGASEHCP